MHARVPVCLCFCPCVWNLGDVCKGLTADGGNKAEEQEGVGQRIVIKPALFYLIPGCLLLFSSI